MGTKISELTIQTPAAGTEYIECIIPPYTPGTNRRISAQDIADLGGGGGPTSGSGTTVVGTAVNLGGTLTADANIITGGNSVFIEGTGTDIPQLGTRAVAGIRQAWTMQRGLLPAWEWHLETGADADLHLEAFDDAGTFAFHAIGVDRSTGVVDFPVMATSPTAAPGTNTTQVASTAFVQAAIAQAKSFVVAVTDEVTPIGTGTAKISFRMPYAMTLTAVRASLVVAQTSGSIFTVDINESGTTILSTKLTIDNTETTSTTAATPPVISDTALADDAVITVDVDQIGSGTAAGLKITLIGT